MDMSVIQVLNLIPPWKNSGAVVLASSKDGTRIQVTLEDEHKLCARVEDLSGRKLLQVVSCPLMVTDRNALALLIVEVRFGQSLKMAIWDQIIASTDEIDEIPNEYLIAHRSNIPDMDQTDSIEQARQKRRLKFSDEKAKKDRRQFSRNEIVDRLAQEGFLLKEHLQHFSAGRREYLFAIMRSVRLLCVGESALLMLVAGALDLPLLVFTNLLVTKAKRPPELNRWHSSNLSSARTPGTPHCIDFQNWLEDTSYSRVIDGEDQPKTVPNWKLIHELSSSYAAHVDFARMNDIDRFEEIETSGYGGLSINMLEFFFLRVAEVVLCLISGLLQSEQFSRGILTSQNFTLTE